MTEILGSTPIRSVEPSLPAGYHLVRHDTIGSTNDEARRLAETGAPDGTLVWALAQTAGRGRRGNNWVSPLGNLYFSLLLRPDCDPASAAQLGFVAAVALGDALPPIAGPTIAIRYKWPNDLLANGRKLGGILLESAVAADGRVGFVIIGIGINLTSSPRDVAYPATSFVEQGLPAPSPEFVLTGFTRHFQTWVERWQTLGFVSVRAAWRSRAVSLGEAIRVRLPTETLHGRFRDIDANGALLLDASDGLRRIAAGDVFPAGP